MQYGFQQAVEGKSRDAVADSIEELAEKIKVDPAVLKATYDRYCELVEKGVDEDFGKPAKFLHPIKGPKFAALRLHPCVTVTFGGLETDVSARVMKPDGSIIRRRNVLFEEDEYVINIGPQHPATHGVLRFRVSLEGEIIKKLDVHCGYIHRGIEKLCESLTYPQTLALTDRLDYLGASQNRHALCMCIEKGLGVEVSERVQYIRTIMDELQRIDSHLLFFSCLCMDMGALTAFFYGFRDREKVLDILEQTTGGRLIQAYNTIGGVQADIHPEFVKKVKELIKYLRPVLKEYHRNLHRQRHRPATTQRHGRADARRRRFVRCYGRHGPCIGLGLRRAQAASRMPCTAKWISVRYSSPRATASPAIWSAWRRSWKACASSSSLVDNIPEGEYQLKMKPVIRVPEGSYYAAVEGSRGEFGVYLESRGDKSPYRLKFRSTGLPLVSCMDTITRGAKIADLIAIGGTLDYVVPDIDR